jgi:hypothetical protein
VADLIYSAGGNIWGEHKDFPKSDWKYEVENGNTVLGYWEWVYVMLKTVQTQRLSAHTGPAEVHRGPIYIAWNAAKTQGFATTDYQLAYEARKTGGLLGYKIRSEVQMQVQFKGFPMFGMLDFLVFHPKGKILLDGKGNKEDTADPNQILYYGLELHAAGENIVDSGFLYWRRNFVRVPASPMALHHFVNGDFARGRKIFERLRLGVDLLEANPSSSNCNHCFWKSTCTESYYRKEAVEVFKGIENVGFGEE